jgi:hypothetical protein
VKYFWAVIVCIVLLYGYKYFSAVRNTVAAQAVADVEAQVEASAAAAEGDTAKATEAILAKRPARKAAVKVQQEKNSEAAKAAEQADPIYAAWADSRVPDAVVDELWANAQAQVHVRKRASDGELGVALRPGGADASPQASDRTAIERIRDFVTGRD